MFDLNRRPILWVICTPIQIKHVHSNVSYQQATYPRYNRRGHESPSGYSPLVKGGPGFHGGGDSDIGNLKYYPYHLSM